MFQHEWALHDLVFVVQFHDGSNGVFDYISRPFRFQIQLVGGFQMNRAEVSG